MGETVVHHAVANNHPSLITKLVSHGADVNAEGSYARTPLGKAALMGQNSAFWALLALNASSDATDKRNDTILHLAVRSGETQMVEVILNFMNGSFDIDARNAFGATPLFTAIFLGQNDIVWDLLEKGNPDVNISENLGYTPLHLAAERGQTELVEKLIEEFDAGLESQNNKGQTALMCAVLAGKHETVKVLLKHGALLPVGESEAESLMANESVLKNYEMVRLLVLHGADVNEVIVNRAEEVNAPNSVKNLLKRNLKNKS